MNIIGISAWVVSQVFIFVVSIYLIVHGIRFWNNRKIISVILFIFAFFGVLKVASTIWSITE